MLAVFSAASLRDGAAANVSAVASSTVKAEVTDVVTAALRVTAVDTDAPPNVLVRLTDCGVASACV